MQTTSPHKLLRLLLPQLSSDMRLGITLKKRAFSIYIKHKTATEIHCVIDEIKTIRAVTSEGEKILDSITLIGYYSSEMCMFSLVAEKAIKWMENKAKEDFPEPYPVSIVEGNLFILTKEN